MVGISEGTDEPANVRLYIQTMYQTVITTGGADYMKAYGIFIQNMLDAVG